MDRLRYHHFPGENLGHLRHRAEVRGRRWRKLPPETGADTRTYAGSKSGADAIGNPVAQPDGHTVADTLGDSGGYTFADPVSDTKCNADAGANPDGNPVAQRNGNADSVGNSDTSSHTDAEGHAFDDGAGCLPDPHKGSGGRDTPQPAAAQAAGGTARPYGSCV